MVALDQCFRFADEAGGSGLNCRDTGLSLAGAPLLRMTLTGFAPRTADEISVLIKSAYGGQINPANLLPGLVAVAQALNRGEIGIAKVVAAQMGLPELGWTGAVRIAQANNRLEKYSPNEPRDDHGRWTTGGAAAAGPRRRPIPNHPAGQRRGRSTSSDPAAVEASSHREASDDPSSTTAWAEPTHLYGGRLISVADSPNLGIGGNGPPPEAEFIAEAEPSLVTPRVPQGWDRPAQTVDGLSYPPSRNPTLADGTPWPHATPELVLSALPQQPGKPPSMMLYVPRDGVGPTLLGATATQDLKQPPGYDSVKLIGTPQATYSRGSQTAHARESTVEALRLAATNQFSTIYFNRSFSTITNRMVESLIRPDVVAVVRPGLDIGYIYHPHEIYSPGQEPRERQAVMPIAAGVRRLEGHSYKVYGYMMSPYFRYIGP